MNMITGIYIYKIRLYTDSPPPQETPPKKQKKKKTKNQFKQNKVRVNFRTNHYQADNTRNVVVV